MSYLDDAAVDDLIREDERNLQKYNLFFQTEEERRRQYGAVSIPKRVVTVTPAPSYRRRLTGIPSEMLPGDDEEMLLHQYEESHMQRNSTDITQPPRAGPPPAGYDGPLLTLTTQGPYTRAEVLASRLPIRCCIEKKSSQRSRSRHYPKSRDCNSMEGKRSSIPGESLRRWKYSMGFPDE